MEITARTLVTIELSPEEIGALFCKMDSTEQARFFNGIAEDVKKWDCPFCFQLQGITDEDCLTPEARQIMKEIGEYHQPYEEKEEVGE